jgi:aminoglycoside phosphotransferase (APT) family kinase protein
MVPTLPERFDVVWAYRPSPGAYLVAVSGGRYRVAGIGLPVSGCRYPVAGRASIGSAWDVTDSPRTPYGFDLDASMHGLLRSRPTDVALAWVESELRARVVGVHPLDGGTSSAVHRLTLETLAGVVFDVVLRRYVRDWVKDEPWLPGNEATVLRLLAGAPAVLAPRLLAADPDGVVDGTPMVLMAALTGEMEWEPADRDAWLWRLAEMVSTIHRVSPSSELIVWAPYPPEPGMVPPRWTKHRPAWEQALSAWTGPPPPSERVFVHRDFHPGNVLWTDGRITGVVDWVSSCLGPAEEDVSHCRVNLVQHHGQAAADQFLAYWQDITGRRDYHPYWDLTNVVSMVEDEPDPAVDEFVAAAAARLR